MGLAMLVMAAGAQNESTFTIDAQLRTRGEYNNGAVYPRGEGQLPATFINERARVSMGFERGQLELKVSAQHTGYWGQDAMNTANGRLTMNEAWVKLKYLGRCFAELGRQQLSYDNERILGVNDWDVNGNWHDALKLGYEDDANKVHVFAAMNQKTANRGNYYDGAMPYKSMQGVWFQHQWESLPLTVSLLGLNTGYEQGEPGHGKTKYMQTVGTNINYLPGNWNLHGEFYYQTGRNADDLKVSTCLASFKAGYQIDDKWKVALGMDYLEGEEYSGGSYSRDYMVLYKAHADRTRAFNPLYGSHHQFYGLMDYFYASGFAGGVEPGLGDLQVDVDYKASDKTSVMLNYHYFTTASDCMPERGLGHEFDLHLTTQLMKDVTLQAGYSVMRGTDMMDYAKGGNRRSWQDWAWVSLNINPRLLSTKW